MKLLVVLVLSVLCLGRAAASPAEDFAKGNAAYTAGQFADAIRQYDSLVRRGESRAGLFLNLGNAWQRSGDLPHAILNYERALLLDPQMAAARANLVFVQNKVAAPPQEPRWWMRLPLIGENFALIAAAVAIWILLFACVARWRRMFGAVNIWTFLIVLSLFATALMGASFWFREYPLAARNRAVLLQNTPLRSTFSDNGSVLANPAAGVVVRVVSVNGPWTNCKMADGTQGWLVSKALEQIVPTGARR